MNTSEQFTLFDLDTPSGRTSPASCPPQIMLSAVSSLPLSVLMKPLKLKKGGPVLAWSADPRDLPLGVFWTLNTSAWPNDASVCSLSGVLETGPIPPQYFLSARACSGILRRAAKRGKELPTALRVALEQVAGGSVGGGESRGQDPVVAVPDVSFCLNAGGARRIDGESETFVAHALRADGFDASEDGTGRGTPLVPVGFRASGQGGFIPSEVCPPITAADGGGAGVPTVMAFHENQRGELTLNDTAGSLKVGGGKPGQGYPAIAFNLRGREGGAMPEPTDVASLRASSGGSSRTYVGVRRLLPSEYEALQGFPKNYTAITYRGKPAADGPRYKALGNSFAVPVIRWIGERILRADCKEKS